MANRKPEPIYGKHGYSIIKTKDSIRKHFDCIDQWDFYYYDGRIARKNGIIKDIHSLSSDLLENGFDCLFETKWQRVLSGFIDQVKSHKELHKKGKDYYINIDHEIAYRIYSFFQMMSCRSPRFNGVGVLEWLDEDLVKKLREENDELLQGIWHTELYRMIYHKQGYYQMMLDSALERCQMVCIEALDDCGTFITSDNPVFFNSTFAPERNNINGYMFPVSPKYILYMCKGKGNFNSMMLRWAGKDDIRRLNGYIYRNCDNAIVSTEKELGRIL